MKILMVNPKPPNTFWNLKYALKFISKKAPLPPLGLLTVAAMLPENWDKKLVDMAVTELTDRDIRWADYVFITGMYINKESVREVINRCKNIGKKMAAGGPLFTAIPEEYGDVDHLVLNEAEITLPEFLKDLANGSPKHIYRTEQRPDLRTTPSPLWSLIDTKHYAYMSVQYSRGCPFDCDFCDVTALFGHRSRTKSREQVLTELENLYAIGWRGNVFFVDDNFIGNKNNLKKEILPAVIDWMKKKKYPFCFNTQTSINLADDDELMTLMTQAGFDCSFIGIETISEASLTECNKTQNKGRNLVDCVKKIQKAGIEVQGGFIIGFDSDDSAIFDNMIKFIQESGIVVAMIGLLNAPRGTKLYNRLLGEKRILDYGSGNNTDLSMNFIPAMNYKDLVEGYQKVVNMVYSPRNYYTRVRTFLKNYEPANKISDTKISFSEIKTLIKSVWYLGLLSGGRKYFWKLILLGIRQPRHFDSIIEFAIFGYHYRKMFEQLRPVLR